MAIQDAAARMRNGFVVIVTFDQHGQSTNLVNRPAAPMFNTLSDAPNAFQIVASMRGSGRRYERYAPPMTP